MRKLFLHSVEKYLPILKANWVFILALALVINLNRLFLNSEGSGYLYMDVLVEFFFAFMMIFIWSCTLKATKNILDEGPVNILKILDDVFKLILPLFLAMVGFVLIFIIIYVIAHLLSFGSGIVAFFLISFPIFILNVLLYLTIPIIVFDNKPAIQAFYESANRIRFEHFLPAFGLYAFSLVIFFLVLPGTHHQLILSDYYLNLPFDLIILGISLPILNALIVLCEKEFKA